MRFSGKVLACFFTSLFAVTYLLSVSKQQNDQSLTHFLSKGLQIRVLLSKSPFKDRQRNWKLSSLNGLIIRDPQGKEKELSLAGKELIIVCKGSSCFINGKKITKDELLLIPKKETIGFEGGSYNGRFLLKKSDSAWLLINCLGIEQYVCSVLRTESWPGWPLEVNKVFAIASRTYAVSMALQGRKSGRPYDVTNKNVR